MNRDKQALLHLTLVDTIGPAQIQKITAQVPYEQLHGIYHFSEADFQTLGLSEMQSFAVVRGLQDTVRLEKEVALIELHKVTIIDFSEKTYPLLLKNIYLPPVLLYLWGELLEHERNYVALVGSRNAHHYVSQVVTKIVPSFVSSGWITVSGGARGADTFVHRKTVELGGKTVVVLGSGLLQCYPPENRKLFQEVIASGGTILSIFPMQTAPIQRNFPARNRVISGLSRGTIVLQAAEKSGALITARFALEQGREVFAVPGSIFDELSAGPHDLIRQGAHALTKVEDFFEVFSFVPQGKMEFQQELNFMTHTHEQGAPYKDLIAYCQEPRSLDEIVSRFPELSETLYDTLFSLQLDGKIEQNHLGCWQVVV